MGVAGPAPHRASTHSQNIPGCGMKFTRNTQVEVQAGEERREEVGEVEKSGGEGRSPGLNVTY